MNIKLLAVSIIVIYFGYQLGTDYDDTQANIKLSKSLEWIADEDYCGDFCDQKELYRMGCDVSILVHLTKYSNLLSEEFDGTYYLEYIGLPKGVSEKKFNECADHIYEKRTSMKSEHAPQNKLWRQAHDRK